MLKVDISSEAHYCERILFVTGKKGLAFNQRTLNTGQILLYLSIRSHLGFIQPVYRRPDFSLGLIIQQFGFK